MTHINSFKQKPGMVMPRFEGWSQVMLIPKRKTWFFVADGAKACLFESLGYREGWTLKKEWRDDTARLPDRALESERPGRGHNIGSGGRYAIAKRSKHDDLESAFVKARTEYINSSRDDFDQLVLAAPPVVLGAMRKKLAQEIFSKLIGVFDKDLTNMPGNELHAYFQERLERW